MSDRRETYLSHLREEPKTTWKLNSSGIDIEAFQWYISNLPYRSVSNVRKSSSNAYYLYDAVDPFIRSEVNDLVAYSAELKEQRLQESKYRINHRRSGSGGYGGRKGRRSREKARDGSRTNIIRVDVRVMLPNQNTPLVSTTCTNNTDDDSPSRHSSVSPAHSMRHLSPSDRSSPSRLSHNTPNSTARPSPNISAAPSPVLSTVQSQNCTNEPRQQAHSDTPVQSPQSPATLAGEIRLPASFPECYQPQPTYGPTSIPECPWSPVSAFSSPKTL
ncbi:Protein of unknown function [Pyronema omphalodes CBS 100304]|uniref:Uncharacterized protein n=1 Tax=Pyronema omphalodes (strain CBS 100304) TaxID=1076935 RepID=U4KZZ5_PYROM|nr:Protein of unknown function [Pyronema omphalodes CBS 100304]